MKLTYKGKPVVFKSQKSEKLFAAAIFLAIPVGFVQLLVAAVGISHVVPIHWLIIAFLLGVLSLELTFQGGSVFRLLPDALRKEMVWIVGVGALIGFQQSNNLTSMAAIVFFACVAYRALISFVGWLNSEKISKH